MDSSSPAEKITVRQESTKCIGQHLEQYWEIAGSVRVIEIQDVFVASMTSRPNERQMASNLPRLTASFSGAASMIRSHFASNSSPSADPIRLSVLIGYPQELEIEISSSFSFSVDQAPSPLPKNFGLTRGSILQSRGKEKKVGKPV